MVIVRYATEFIAVGCKMEACITCCLQDHTMPSLRIKSRHHAYSSTFCCLLRLLLPCLQGTGDGKNELALQYKDDVLENGEESQGVDVPSGSHMQETRPASLDELSLKRGMLLRLGLGWL